MKAIQNCINVKAQVVSVMSILMFLLLVGDMYFANLAMSSPLDSDQDGMPNDWELSYGLDPFDPSDAWGDLDKDRLSNLKEFQGELDPTLSDSDNDSIPDGLDSRPLDNIYPDNFLAHLPNIYVVLNGSIEEGFFPGVGRLQVSGNVLEITRYTQEEVGNSYTAFGVAVDSMGGYWTSTYQKLFNFNPVTGDIIQSFGTEKLNDGVHTMTFGADDSIYGVFSGQIFNVYLNEKTFSKSLISNLSENFSIYAMGFTPNNVLQATDARDKRFVQIIPETGVEKSYR